MPVSSRRNLLLTFDAFNTLFHPRLPIAVQYTQTAQALSFLPPSFPPDELQSAFRTSFKHEAKLHPNYGRNQSGFGGPKVWWGKVISGCFQRLRPDANIPEELIPNLIERFQSNKGYTLFWDVDGFFERMTKVRARKSEVMGFDKVVVGIVSNSDDRVNSILSSLGLKVGHRNDGSSPGDVDFIVTSYEAGEEKPHRHIFDVARQRATEILADGSAYNNFGRTENLTCVHVGDDYEKDYKGAINAGWKSYLLPRDGDTASVIPQLSENEFKSADKIGTLSDIFSKLELNES